MFPVRWPEPRKPSGDLSANEPQIRCAPANGRESCAGNFCKFHYRKRILHQCSGTRESSPFDSGTPSAFEGSQRE